MDEVRRRSSDGDALARLDAALALSERLQGELDALVGHFVGEARKEGQSWTAIGQHLGVSKQAARKRFVGVLSSPPGSTPRLVRCLQAAHTEAADAGAREVGTDHLLLGLFLDGVAATTLEKLGLTADRARAEARRLFPGPEQGERASLVDSAETLACHQGAADMARRAECGYVGTEHVLMAIVLDAGSRGRRVLQSLGADLAAIKRDLACFVEPPRSHRRRRRKAKWVGETGCSFCGKEADERWVVAGPGVRICRDCVELSAEILARQ